MDSAIRIATLAVVVMVAAVSTLTFIHLQDFRQETRAKASLSVSELSSQIDNLQQQLDRLETRITEMEDQIEGLSQGVDELINDEKDNNEQEEPKCTGDITDPPCRCLEYLSRDIQRMIENDEVESYVQARRLEDKLEAEMGQLRRIVRNNCRSCAEKFRDCPDECENLLDRQSNPMARALAVEEQLEQLQDELSDE